MSHTHKKSWNVLAKHQAELTDGSVYQSKIKAKSKQNQSTLKFIIKF